MVLCLNVGDIFS